VVEIAELRPPPRRAPKDEALELLALELPAEFEPAPCEFVVAAEADALAELGAAGEDGDEPGDLLVLLAACAPLAAEEFAAGADLDVLEFGVVAPLGVAGTSSGMGGTTGGA
jgi:hypothetical protein